MSSREEIYQKAFALKHEKKNKQEMNRRFLLSAAYQTHPRLSEIDWELAGVGTRLAITALNDMSGFDALRRHAQALSAEKAELLKKADIPPETFDCPLCQDSGYVSGKICQCVHALAAELRAKELSDETPLANSRFDNFELRYYSDRPDAEGRSPRQRMASILKVCTDYVEGFDPKTAKNLLFLGQAGLGKTHLSLAIVSGVLSRGFTPVYGSAESLFNKLERERFGSENRGAYDSVLQADLLVIDDLGAEMTTSFTRAALNDLLNTRLLAGRPVIINTNLSMKEIAMRYTARISSRLIGHYEAWEFLGNDIRQQKMIESRGIHGNQSV